MIAIFAAVTFAAINASNHVTDLVLSRIGPFNVRFLFVYAVCGVQRGIRQRT